MDRFSGRSDSHSTSLLVNRCIVGFVGVTITVAMSFVMGGRLLAVVSCGVEVIVFIVTISISKPPPLSCYLRLTVAGHLFIPIQYRSLLIGSNLC